MKTTIKSCYILKSNECNFGMFYVAIKKGLKCTSHMLLFFAVIYADKCWMNCIKNTIQIATLKST